MLNQRALQRAAHYLNSNGNARIDLLKKKKADIEEAVRSAAIEALNNGIEMKPNYDVSSTLFQLKISLPGFTPEQPNCMGTRFSATDKKCAVCSSNTDCQLQTKVYLDEADKTFEAMSIGAVVTIKPKQKAAEIKKEIDRLSKELSALSKKKTTKRKVGRPSQGERNKYIEHLISASKYTREQIREKVRERFGKPAGSDAAINTVLTDAKNKKYNRFKHLATEKAGGIFCFKR